MFCPKCVIAKTGTFPYFEREIGIEGGADGIVRIERRPEDLFNPETIASFEGKPIVIGHSEYATPDNWSKVAKGVVQNVRRGAGADADKLIADLLITDAETINKVQSGELEELSCGYDAEIEKTRPGFARHKGFVGNHVALVKRARCGSVCRIGDSLPTMSFKNTIRKFFKDGDENGLNDYLDEIKISGDDGGKTHVADAGDGGAPAPQPEPAKDPNADLAARVAALESQIGKIVAVLQKVFTPTEGGAATGDGEDDGAIMADPADSQQVLNDGETIAPGIDKPVTDGAGGKISVKVLERYAKRALNRYGRFGDADPMEGAALFATLHAAALLRKQENNPRAAATAVKDAAPAFEHNSAESINGMNAKFWNR